MLQHQFARQLRRRILVAVRDRNIGGDTDLAAQRDADQLGGHRLERSGFGIQRGQAGLVDALQPLVQLGFGQHGFVLPLDRCKQAALGRFGRARFAVGSRRGGFSCAVGGVGGIARCAQFA
jgi:hypothetical protein